MLPVHVQEAMLHKERSLRQQELQREREQRGQQQDLGAVRSSVPKYQGTRTTSIVVRSPEKDRSEEQTLGVKRAMRYKELVRKRARAAATVNDYPVGDFPGSKKSRHVLEVAVTQLAEVPAIDMIKRKRSRKHSHPRKSSCE